jgi:transcription initiation factor TFIID subunit 2
MQWVFSFMRMYRRLSPDCCDCTAIHSVTVAGHPAEFTHHDPLTHINMGGPAEAQDCHRHAELKRKIYSALQESDEGELSIAVPREVALKQSVHSSCGATVSEGMAQIS